MFKRHSVFWFAITTLVLSFGVYFLPLPDAQKSLLVPVVMVFVPAIVSSLIVLLTEGMDGLRHLFARVRGVWRWVLIGIGFGVLIRVMALAIGILLGTSIRPDLSVPGTTFVLLAPIPLAWFEELGWRRFALDRMLKSYSPLASALILGLPWSILHLTIILPGMMNEGAPAIPQTISLIALSIILTWAYVRSSGSLLTVTLLHGIQNGLSVINRGLDMAEATWLMMGVYGVLAVLLVLFEHRLFLAKPTRTQSLLAQA